jgi:hypothetical protein
VSLCTPQEEDTSADLTSLEGHPSIFALCVEKQTSSRPCPRSTPPPTEVGSPPPSSFRFVSIFLFESNSPHQPLYGEAFARYCRRLSVADVFEVGGGSGTFAVDFLRFASKNFKSPFNYNLVEISPQLADIQRLRVAEFPNARVDNADFVSSRASPPSESVVIALEAPPPRPCVMSAGA